MVLVVLIVLGMVLLVVCAAMWPEPDDDAPPSTSEGVLARRLLAGEIDQRQYRTELARLARGRPMTR